MLPGATWCSKGFHKCVRERSTSVINACLRLPSFLPSCVASSSPPAPPPTMTILCRFDFCSLAIGRHSQCGRDIGEKYGFKPGVYLVAGNTARSKKNPLRERASLATTAVNSGGGNALRRFPYRDQSLDCRAIDRREHRAQRRGNDVAVHSRAIQSLVAADANLYVSHRCRILATAHRMLVIVHDVDVDTAALAQRTHEGIHRSVALAGNRNLAPVEFQTRRDIFDFAVAGFMRDAMLDVGKRPLDFQIFLVERGLDRDRRQLLAGLIRDRLDHLAELDLQQARQRHAEIALEQVGNAALARLAVDADDGFVSASEVGRID